MSKLLNSASRFVYKNVAKPLFFLMNPETVHVNLVKMGEASVKIPLVSKITSVMYRKELPELRQQLFGIDFALPLGLAAGFDYEARLTQVLSTIGFGFGTIGTITNLPYEGNARPMLGRLPKSKSLMVNKGFKNLGIRATLERLRGKKFAHRVGLSIGKTNTDLHATQQEGIADIVSAFKIAEESDVPFSYYELNVSCPNLKGSVEFYDPSHLRDLLTAISKLLIVRPVFIKMPISKSDREIETMLEVIVEFPFVRAVILGNLMRDRSNPGLVPEEVMKFDRGNFSGKPCQTRSDELIALAYRKFGKKIKVIGCGGVFGAEDAYKKIRLGASLVQLITGMIFEGPQLVSEINDELVRMLKRDGFKHITEAIGADNR